MKNIIMEIEGDILTLKIKLTDQVGPSASGKTILIASSGGNQPIGHKDMKLGLNLYAPNPNYVAPAKA